MAYDRIEDFKRLHNRQSVFVLASGPSLGELDLSPLKRRIVIGLNRSNLLYPDTHYHCVMDLQLFEKHDDLLRRSRYLFTFPDRPFGIPVELLGAEGFSLDLSRGIYSGYTVSYFALQLAVYMGFSRVFFLGLDLKHQQGATHFFGSDWVSKNHETTEFPKMIRMLGLAADKLRGAGVSVYNCSPISNLECFERVSYEWALKQ